MKKTLKILVIDDDVVPLARVVIQSLGIAYPGSEIYVLSLRHGKLLSYRYSRYVKAVYTTEATGDKQSIEYIEKAVKDTRADVLIPIKEKTVRIVAENLYSLQKIVRIPPMPDPVVLERVRNKWLLYNWLFEKGYASSRPMKFCETIDALKDNSHISFPLLVKPFWGSGGRGIHLIRTREDLINFQPGKDFNPDEVLVQSYIPGYDIDISVLTWKGKILCYTIQKGLKQEKKMVYSKTIEFKHNDALYARAVQILSDLDYSGIAHLDFRFNSSTEQYELVDFNARYWSTLLGSLNAGINFTRIACEYALGNNPGQVDFREGKYCALSSPFIMFSTKMAFRDTELRYNLMDPKSYLADTFQKIRDVLKRSSRCM